MNMKEIGWFLFAVMFMATNLFSGEESPALRVCVLEGYGSGALVSTLSAEARIEAVEIARVRADLLEGCDVMIITQQKSPALLMRSVQAIISWVNGGGGILFLHDAVGYRAHIAMFPSIGEGFNHPKLDRVRIAKEHPVSRGIAVGHVFSPGFKFDHVVIKAGVDGETVVDNENGESVVVVGKAGKGRVVLNGMLTGHWGANNDSGGYEKEPEGEERQILINSIRWLAGDLKGSEAVKNKWTDRLIPLPKEVSVSGSTVVSASQISLLPEMPEGAVMNTCVDIIKRFARCEGANVKAFIALSLADIGASSVSEDILKRLATLPNSEQAYAILTSGTKEGVLRINVVANTTTGLSYGCRTLDQLLKAGDDITEDTPIEVPIVSILDWPDIPERGQWSNYAVENMEWLSRWKLNIIENSADPKIDNLDSPAYDMHYTGKPMLGLVKKQREYILQAGRYGITIVPYIGHLGHMACLENHGLLNTRYDPKLSYWLPALAVQSPHAPFNPHKRGLCLTNPVTIELLTEWMRQVAELIEGQGSELAVWLSENANDAGCYCENCAGRADKDSYDPWVTEAEGILKAFNNVKKEYPNLKLRIWLSQGSYPSNAKVIAAVPEDVKIIYSLCVSVVKSLRTSR